MTGAFLNLEQPHSPGCGCPLCLQNSAMKKSNTVGVTYGDLRKQCLEAVRQWPGCKTISGIQIIRDHSPAGFSVRITLYGEANQKIANRAMIYIEREKRRHCRLME